MQKIIDEELRVSKVIFSCFLLVSILDLVHISTMVVEDNKIGLLINWLVSLGLLLFTFS